MSGGNEITSQAAREQVAEVVGAMRAVLAKDFAIFPSRVGKKRFLDGGSFSESLSDAQIKAIKADLQSLVTGTLADVLRALEPLDPWLVAKAELPREPPRTLEPNAAVWAELQRGASAVAAVLEKHGFPDRLCAVTYKTPTWFIDGAYMPGLIEKYWKWLGLLAEAEMRERKIEEDAGRRSLSHRWDEA